MIYKFRKAVLVLIVLLLLSVIHLYFNTQNITAKYAVTDLKIKAAELRSQNRQAGIQVARQENLAAIEQTATGKLRMSYPEKINYVLPKTPRSPLQK